MVAEKPEYQWCSQKAEKSNCADASILLKHPSPDVGELRPGEALAADCPGWNLLANFIRQDREAEIGCVGGQNTRSPKKKQEIVLVVIADTVVDKNTVMV